MCSLGSSMLKKYKIAVGERNRQIEAHRGFTESLPEDLVNEWESICITWDADGFPKTAENPYKVDSAGTRTSNYDMHHDDKYLHIFSYE